MTQPTVLIVGPGRSGTSFTARICHEKLGICMGRFLKPADEFNPEGYYEDHVSHGLLRSMAAGVLSPETYLEIMSEVAEELSDAYPGTLPWGVKDPWLLYLEDHILEKLQPNLVIACTRPSDAVALSFVRIYDKLTEDAVDSATTATEVDALHTKRMSVLAYHQKRAQTRSERLQDLPNLFPNVLTLDFSYKRSETEIQSLIQEALS